MHPDACFDINIFARATQLKASTCQFAPLHKLVLHPFGLEVKPSSQALAGFTASPGAVSDQLC